MANDSCGRRVLPSPTVWIRCLLQEPRTPPWQAGLLCQAGLRAPTWREQHHTAAHSSPHYAPPLARPTAAACGLTAVAALVARLGRSR